MITRKMVRNGYDRGIIELELSPNNDGIVARIGEYWFYFGGMAASIAESVDQYKKDIPRKSIIRNIGDTLKDFLHDEGFDDEYRYYEAILKESGCDK